MEFLSEEFQVCKENSLKLNPEIWKLDTDEVQLCVPILNSNGVNLHPRPYESLTSMQAPTTFGALMHLVHGSNCMKTAIILLLLLITPLHGLLESNYNLNKTLKKIVSLIAQFRQE